MIGLRAIAPTPIYNGDRVRALARGQYGRANPTWLVPLRCDTVRISTPPYQDCKKPRGRGASAALREQAEVAASVVSDQSTRELLKLKKKKCNN